MSIFFYILFFTIIRRYFDGKRYRHVFFFARTVWRAENIIQYLISFYLTEAKEVSWMYWYWLLSEFVSMIAIVQSTIAPKHALHRTTFRFLAFVRQK